MEFAVKHLKGFGSLFYTVNPYETMFETLDQLPHPNWTAKVRTTRAGSGPGPSPSLKCGLGLLLH
jgi:hypothetical protein